MLAHKLFLPVALTVAIAFAACDSNGADDLELCADLTGGALITIEVEGESFTDFFTDAAFITEAKSLKASGQTKNPVFEEVFAGKGCDNQWKFNVDAEDVHWADMTIELCDGRPSYVSGNLEDWMDQVGSWCPWGAKVTNVEDRP